MAACAATTGPWIASAGSSITSADTPTGSLKQEAPDLLDRPSIACSHFIDRTREAVGHRDPAPAVRSRDQPHAPGPARTVVARHPVRTPPAPGADAARAPGRVAHHVHRGVHQLSARHQSVAWTVPARPASTSTGPPTRTAY